MNAVILALLLTVGAIVLVYFVLKIAMKLFDKSQQGTFRSDQPSRQHQSNDALSQAMLYSTLVNTNASGSPDNHPSHKHHPGSDAPAHDHHSGHGCDGGHHHSSDSFSSDSGSGDSGSGGGGDSGGGGSSGD